jgi:drug/metabolite transporter (DMT)-like permease
MSKEKKGEIILFLQACLWGGFPIVTILSYNTLTPVVSLALSSFVATLFFAVMLTIKKKWHEVRDATALKDILLATVFIGIIYYLLEFIGLQHTTAGNGSIVAESEIFFSYLLFNLWKKDTLPFVHFLGALFMVIGSCIVLYPNLHSFNQGDLLILLAASIAPFGNYFAKRARKRVGSEAIMFIRSFISALFLFGLASVIHNTITLTAIKSSFLIICINGIVMFGFVKMLWIEGIHRVSVVKANALTSTAPLFTLFFAWLILHNTPTIWQLSSFIPMFIGILLLGINKQPTKQEKSSS